ncbi:hypothetical protein LTS08_004853 [Lithohypha guttulata]|nr:hypothetical protein LTS08_004853 [Lithohypha guttulata]
MDPNIVPRKLWEHPDIPSTQLFKFKLAAERSTNKSFPTYSSLYDWSITHQSDFWTLAFKHFPIVYTGTIPSPCFDESARMDSVPAWFKGVKLNFAENILFTGDAQGRATKRGKEDDKIVVRQVREGSFDEPIVTLTWGELRKRVGRLSNAMRARGVHKGDRIALVASTSIDTLTVFLAATSLGALFSSSSTDMGVKGILDRLLQIRPKFLFMDDAAVYNGKTVDLRAKMKDIVAGMEGVSEFVGVVTQTRFMERGPADLAEVPRAQTWDGFLSVARGDDELRFESCDFDDPMIIVYSSGTTGQPKCIVHRIGGVVLNGHKEGRLHREIDETTTQLQYTTTGWIMYLGSIQALLMGARIVTYDGSPFLPRPDVFVKLLGQEKVTHFGTSPRYLQTLQQHNIAPRKTADLSCMRAVTCTGMVLSNALFEWFYDVGFPSIVQLDNISGGTDLAGAWGTGNPILPVYIGGCQCLSLGMPVKVFDSTIEPTEEELRKGIPMKGREVNQAGEPGDLVGTGAFPTMPLYFFGDEDKITTPGGARVGKKYFDSYFAKYDGVWTHGDFISIHPKTGQVVFLGRADGVLNPSGVRFGSSEIYSVIEKHFSDTVSDSICVGQRRPQDIDERVLLFVLMKEGHRFTPALVKNVRARIAEETSKRHVPAFVFETPEIPTTVNGKKVELPVKQIVCGKKVKPSGTLANPGSLEFYYRFAEDENLREMEQAKL